MYGCYVKGDMVEESQEKESEKNGKKEKRDPKERFGSPSITIVNTNRNTNMNSPRGRCTLARSMSAFPAKKNKLST